MWRKNPPKFSKLCYEKGSSPYILWNLVFKGKSWEGWMSTKKSDISSLLTSLKLFYVFYAKNSTFLHKEFQIFCRTTDPSLSDLRIQLCSYSEKRLKLHERCGIYQILTAKRGAETVMSYKTIKKYQFINMFSILGFQNLAPLKM